MLTISRVDVDLAGARVLRGTDLLVPRGSFVGLFGRNGAGKTTLFRTLMGLVSVTSGEVLLNGRRVGTTDAHLRVAAGVGYMPEDRRLVPSLTARENILLPSGHLPKSDTAARLRAILERIPELEQHLERRATSMSGGQQKLVALARAMLVGEKLLVLDEPTEGVAPALAARIVDILRGLKARGATVLVAESNAGRIQDLCEKVYTIERGATMSGVASR